MSLPSIFNDNKVKINKIIKVIPFITNSLMFKILVSLNLCNMIFKGIGINNKIIPNIFSLITLIIAFKKPNTWPPWKIE